MIAQVGFAFVLAMAALMASLIVRHAVPFVRHYIQFAALLYLAFATALIVALVFPTAASESAAATGSNLVCALAPASLVVAVFASFEHRPRGWIVSIVLLAACVCGLFSASTGAGAPAVTALFASVCGMLALAVRKSRRDWRVASDVIIASLCLIAGAASTASQSSQIAFALFSAAGLLGIALGVSRKSHLTIEEDGDILLLEPIDLRR
jgi:hypothetical protein